MPNKWAFIINLLLLLEVFGLDLDLYECEHFEIMDGGDGKWSPSKLNIHFPTLSWKHEQYSSRTSFSLFTCSEHRSLCSPFFAFVINNEKTINSCSLACSKDRMFYFSTFFVLTVGSDYLLLLPAYQYI